MTENYGRLGVNIDHIATLRQLRKTPYPDLVQAAFAVEGGGADQITIHLREDRRHIQDSDVRTLRKQITVPMNLEMALNEPIIRLALKIQPDWVCFVPEKRSEVTTEGGLDLSKKQKKMKDAITRLKKAGIWVSLFIEPSLRSVRLSQELGADAVELHTGKFCEMTQKSKKDSPREIRELERIRKAAKLARKLGLKPHAGHGLDYENVRPVAALKDDEDRMLIEEFNIGHSIVCRAAFVGLERAVKEMKSAILAL